MEPNRLTNWVRSALTIFLLLIEPISKMWGKNQFRGKKIKNKSNNNKLQKKKKKKNRKEKTGILIEQEI